jgi:adenosylhomocysteine nucleosidase
MTSDASIVLLTAIDREYQAAVRYLINPKTTRHHRGTEFDVGTLRGAGVSVALGQTGKGNLTAATLTERAIEFFSPIAVIFVGVAGATSDATNLGDVVVATHVYGYHGGLSEGGGVKARPRVWETPHEVVQIAGRIKRENSWLDAADSPQTTPRVHFGPIAAGELVHNSRSAPAANVIRQVFNDSLAVEMEGAGIAQAGHLGRCPVAVVRGISDHADGRKTTDSDRHWQPLAAAHAAAFAARLAAELSATNRPRPEVRDTDRTIGPTPAVLNIATGQVGVQARDISHSTVSVDIASTDAHPDVLDGLREIAELLHQKRARGLLDSDTYAAAAAEVDLASGAWREGTVDGSNRAVIALKRLYGLVTGLAEIATRVSGIIIAAQGLS